jgi:hypothetical protein
MALGSVIRVMNYLDGHFVGILFLAVMLNIESDNNIQDIYDETLVDFFEILFCINKRSP